MPKPQAAESAERGCKLRLTEAERILAKLTERQQAGVEMPESMIEQARERVSAAREELEALKGKT